MSKRKQPERSAKKPKPLPKSSRKPKKGKLPKEIATAPPEEIAVKKTKVDNSALDQLKTVISLLILDDESGC